MGNINIDRDTQDISATTGDVTINGVVPGAGAGASVTVQSAVPSTPAAGDLWYQTDDGVMYIYYTDADTSQWVPVDSNSEVATGVVLQQIEATPHSTYGTNTTPLTPAFDNTIPQNTEGSDTFGGVTLPTVSITPTSTTNRLIIEAEAPVINTNAGTQAMTLMIFQDSDADALAVISQHITTSSISQLSLTHELVSGTTSATTFKMRIGGSATGYGVNGNASGALFGGTMACRLRVKEIKV